MDKKDLKDKKTFLQSLRSYFLAGLVVSAPIGITVLLIAWVVKLFDDLFTPFIPEKYRLEQYIGYDIPGVGMLFGVFIILVIGFLTANFFGKYMFNFWNNLIMRMPVFGTVYKMVQKVIELFVQNKGSAFSKAVLVEYPRKGIWAIGFLTNEVYGEVKNNVEEDSIVVFIPTTPNPTSGFMLFVPRNEAKVLDMSVEEALQFVVSAGITQDIE